MSDPKTTPEMDTYEDNTEARLARLPEAIRDRVTEGDPYWCSLPDGWHDLVTKLDAELRTIDPDYVLDQCKEKFGALRYYVDFSDQCRSLKKADDIISKYEHLSEQTCDICGELGKNSSKNGWLATRCEEHNITKETETK